MRKTLFTLPFILLLGCATPNQRELHARYAEIEGAYNARQITYERMLQMKNEAYNAYAGGQAARPRPVIINN